MEQQTQQAVDAVKDGWQNVYRMAEQYAFSVIGALLLVIIGYFIAGVVERALAAALSRVPGFDATLSKFFAKIARYAVLVMVLVMVLGQFGVQTASIIAAIGAIGLAVGLALQGTLQNIAAGIMLLALRPFRVGESVEVGDVSGTVEEIGLFATRLKTGDGLYVLAPNSNLWDKPVRNFTRNAVRKASIEISVAQSVDVEKALSILTGLANEEPRVLKNPAPSADVVSLKDGASHLSLGYWTNEADFGAVKNQITKQTKLTFAHNGIELAEKKEG